MRPESVKRYLQRIIEPMGAELESGAFVTVREGATRVRELPMQKEKSS